MDSLTAWVALASALLFTAGTTAQEVRLDGTLHHLGVPGKPEWDDFADPVAEGPSLAFRFRAKAQAGEATLRLTQRGVKLDRTVSLNGRAIGKLVADEADLVLALPVPPGTLREGDNLLEVGTPPAPDDIFVGRLTLDPRPRAQAVGGSTLVVTVTEETSNRPLPCRLTLVDADGSLVPILADPDPRLAVRTGVVYTADGRARLGVRPGKYTIYATRGFEYGLATRGVTLAEGKEAAVALTLRREVPTPGLVACDTHVHTLTHSGHGDATLDERLVTLAGEGVEMPVATDHGHLTDFAPAAKRLGLAGWMTPVVGDEVTTRRGHFNAFPFDPGGPPPDDAPRPWPDLVRDLRAGSADRVVILNHPRDTHAGFRPFDPERFNAASGEDREGVAYSFDAVEVINSGAQLSDPTRAVRDWMGLWNHGQELTAVAGSDSHDVSRFIVGQGRTYVSTGDADPGRINVSDACKSLRAGRALVSLGLLARLTVDDKAGPGDFARVSGESLKVVVTVLGPSWVKAERVELFANGVKVREERIARGDAAGEKARVEWSIPKPTYDVTLVALASGPGVTAPYWPVARPYQPTSTAWRPRVLGLTNPVRVDADGNGTWNSPRYYAQFLIEIFGTEPQTLFRGLSAYDEAVATQAAAMCMPPGRTEWDPVFAKALETAPEPIRRGFAAYAASLARP